MLPSAADMGGSDMQVKRGWLLKTPPPDRLKLASSRRAHLRYFVLSPGTGVLRYYKDVECRNLKGEILLRLSEGVVEKKLHATDTTTFGILTANKTYVLTAETGFKFVCVHHNQAGAVKEEEEEDEPARFVVAYFLFFLLITEKDKVSWMESIRNTCKQLGVVSSNASTFRVPSKMSRWVPSISPLLK